MTKSFEKVDLRPELGSETSWIEPTGTMKLHRGLRRRAPREGLVIPLPLAPMSWPNLLVLVKHYEYAYSSNITRLQEFKLVVAGHLVVD